MIMLLIIALLLFLVLLGTGLYVFFTACPRRAERPWLDEEAMGKSDLANYYKYIVQADRWLKENAQDVWTESHDGLKLHAYWAPAQKPIGTIILMHGYRSSMLVDFSLIFPFYHALGLNLLVPHQRSHGQSEGKMITFGVKEHRDVGSWVAYHDQHLWQGKIILSGLSMGASTVMYCANEDFPDHVKGIIADCGFTSPRAILSKCFQDVVKLPGWIAMWSAKIWCKLLADFDIDGKDSRITLAQSRRPVLLLHGKADDFVPFYMSQQALDNSKGNVTLLAVEGAGHGLCYLTDPSLCEKALQEFIFRCLEVSAP